MTALDVAVEPCHCGTNAHEPRRIVLTGGPSGGKTRLLETIRNSLCSHVGLLPESASIVFGGGFPRNERIAARRAAQRTIYHVQDELERMVSEEGAFGIVLCDRGTLDGLAYWPDDEETFFEQLETTREWELSRYAAVLHLRTPAVDGYDMTNALRIESPREAAALDEKIAWAWRGHAHRVVIDAAKTFDEKLAAALAVVRAELPPCCLGDPLRARQPACDHCEEVTRAPTPPSASPTLPTASSTSGTTPRGRSR
jgi:hypothetical protein